MSVSVRPLRWRRLVLNVALAASGTGCYAYHPVDLPTVEPGADVRVHITWSGLERLEEVLRGEALGLGEDPVLRGRLLTRDAGGLMLSVPVRDGDPVYSPTRINQRVSVPLSAVAGVEQRTLRRLATGLAIAGGAVGAAMVWVHIVGDAFFRGRRPEPLLDSDESVVVPLLRFRVF